MITAGDVAAWGQFATPTGTELTLMNRVIDAVQEHVEINYVTGSMVDDEWDPTLTPAQEQAILMHVARVWNRRQSPQGIAAFNEFGPVRVSKLDPDVERFLEPVVVFA